MKTIFQFLIYIVGFFVFYNVMEYFHVSEKTKPYLPGYVKEDNILPIDSKEILTTTKQEVGRRAWMLLHSMSLVYPVNPTEEDKKNFENFMKALSLYYPCKTCAGNLRKILESHPVKAGSRKELVEYLCDLHNIVNKALKKPIFDCNKIYDRWGGRF